MENFYVLPELPYGYDELAPGISEELLKLHHQKHHGGYVEKANAILKKLDETKKDSDELNIKAELKELSFNIGGHILHSLFWNNLAPSGRGGGGEPNGKIRDVLEDDFGSLENFKNLFMETAISVEGSGWAALTYCTQTGRLLLMQIEKHNVNIYPKFEILCVLDAFEHAYYLDYKNEKKKFFENFWNIINWPEINLRFERAIA